MKNKKENLYGGILLSILGKSIKKDSILKEARSKKQCIFRGKKVKIKCEFSLETMQTK